MTHESQTSPTKYVQAAKASWMAPFIAIILNVTVGKNSEDRLTQIAVALVALTIIAVGLLFAIWAIIGAFRQGPRRILVPACIGLLINGFLIFVTINTLLLARQVAEQRRAQQEAVSGKWISALDASEVLGFADRFEIACRSGSVQDVVKLVSAKHLAFQITDGLRIDAVQRGREAQRLQQFIGLPVAALLHQISQEGECLRVAVNHGPASSSLLYRVLGKGDSRDYIRVVIAKVDNVVSIVNYKQLTIPLDFKESMWRKVRADALHSNLKAGALTHAERIEAEDVVRFVDLQAAIIDGRVDEAGKVYAGLSEKGKISSDGRVLGLMLGIARNDPQELVLASYERCLIPELPLEDIAFLALQLDIPERLLERLEPVLLQETQNDPWMLLELALMWRNAGNLDHARELFGRIQTGPETSERVRASIQWLKTELG